MAESKTEERKLETFMFKGKEYQRDAKTKAIVVTHKPSEMKTQDEVEREEAAKAEKEAEAKRKAKPDADTDTKSNN